jgi:hypothetical protein
LFAPLVTLWEPGVWCIGLGEGEESERGAGEGEEATDVLEKELAKNTGEKGLNKDILYST